MVLHSYILSVFFSVLQVITSSLHSLTLSLSVEILKYSRHLHSCSINRAILCSCC
uniref:Uncharacterized protein n=1 Tax=Arundo donax TaxID=35708 RepID=A0A0A9HVH1_ARUDO